MLKNYFQVNRPEQKKNLKTEGKRRKGRKTTAGKCFDFV